MVEGTPFEQTIPKRRIKRVPLGVGIGIGIEKKMGDGVNNNSTCCWGEQKKKTIPIPKATPTPMKERNDGIRGEQQSTLLLGGKEEKDDPDSDGESATMETVYHTGFQTLTER